MYGISNLSTIPVRTEPSDKSELCTQLLFGDGYIIIEENEKWYKIKILFDEYIGWIDKLQHNAVDEAFFQVFMQTDHQICLDDVAVVEHHHGTQLIALGATLPFLNGRIFKIGTTKYTYQGELYHTQKIDIDFVKFMALRYNHVPYLWGGRTLFGTDCSGYTQMVFKILGYKIKRDAYQQAEHGIKIDIEETKTGDLAFFENQLGKIVHVGIMLDQNQIIHAHGAVRIDVVDEKGIFNLTTKKYSHKLSTVKRILSIDQNY
ncbi:MAG: NlpC/P60 family protein [Cytophagales bacterium]